MRISSYEEKAIVETIISFDPDAKIYLYGSRCDDTKRGGDIDIAVLSGRIDRIIRSKIRLQLFDLIGEQKIDIVTGNGKSPFLKKALQTGVLLSG